MRLEIYKEIEALRGRPLLVYATQFVPSSPNRLAPVTIDVGDIDGFTDLVSTVPAEHRSVDVLIHSPGGQPEATERIVSILRSRFDQITFLVPHSAYSAATMLVMSGNDVLLHPTAVLGPIDPQINGTPARSIRRGFEKVRELLKQEGPEALPAYLPLIEKYTLELLEICEDYQELSKELVIQWLTDYMFQDDDKADVIKAAVEFLADYDTHKTHSRPFTIDKIDGLGLAVAIADEELAELMREAYLVINGTFEISALVKLFENTSGISWGRQFAVAPGRPPSEESEE